MICKLPVARVALRITNLAGRSSVVTLNSTVPPWAERTPGTFCFHSSSAPTALPRNSGQSFNLYQLYSAP
jgi:hypothetical protein